VRVCGLVSFAVAERGGQGGERREQPVPEVRRSISAVIQQQPGDPTLYSPRVDIHPIGKGSNLARYSRHRNVPVSRLLTPAG
jgi:hypothetical protein